ncbi:MAG: nitroreductase family protein [Spirochaetales bacterium]|nr:nitroreductase family protein [Spirochaetales bacterium]
MDVYEAIRTRKSVRSYLDRAVEPEKLQRVLEAARLAPSANNRQEWRFVVVTDATVRRRLGEAAAGQRFVGEAPVVIAACAETDRHNMCCGIPCYPVDVAIAIDHLTLAATAEGLGTCWIGAFDPQKVREILGIPPEVEVVELLPLGYPRDPKPVSKSRLPMDRIVRRERW